MSVNPISHQISCQTSWDNGQLKISTKFRLGMASLKTQKTLLLGNLKLLLPRMGGQN